METFSICSFSVQFPCVCVLYLLFPWQMFYSSLNKEVSAPFTDFPSVFTHNLTPDLNCCCTALINSTEINSRYFFSLWGTVPLHDPVKERKEEKKCYLHFNSSVNEKNIHLITSCSPWIVLKTRWFLFIVFNITHWGLRHQWQAINFCKTTSHISNFFTIFLCTLSD